MTITHLVIICNSFVSTDIYYFGLTE